MNIPKRAARTILVEELDPLNPLWLWHQFVTPEVLQLIADHTNEHDDLDYEVREKHTLKERSWSDVTGADNSAYLGAAMLMGVHP